MSRILIAIFFLAGVPVIANEMQVRTSTIRLLLRLTAPPITRIRHGPELRLKARSSHRRDL